MKNTFSGWKIVLMTGIMLTMTAALSAQITISLPKIPKIKKEKPQPETTGKPESYPSSSSSLPSIVSSGPASEIRGGAALPGAKVYFSTTPFTGSNAGAKTTFTSQDFIYGRLELNRPIAEVFGLTKMPKRDYYFLKYKVFIGNEEMGIGPHTGNHLFLSKEDAGKNYLNFDVWPDGNNVNTVLAVVDEIWNYKFPANIVSEHDVRTKFPKNGDYPIRVLLFEANFDD